MPRNDQGRLVRSTKASVSAAIERIVEKIVHSPFTTAFVLLSLGLSLVALSRHEVLVALRCEWQGLAKGQIWRIVSGPLVHASVGHALRDLLPLGAFGWLLEPRFPRALPFAVVTSLALALPLTRLSQPEVAGYLGSSPAAYALFFLWIAAPRDVPRPRILDVAALVLIARLLEQWIVGPPVLVQTKLMTASALTAPATHLGGIAVGLLAARARALGRFVHATRVS